MNTLEQDFQAVMAGKQPANLYDPISYILLQPGKRLRPQLVHMAAALFDGNPEQAQYVAMAFEMLHNFTLIHDDIMDEAPIRRGKETVYKKWNSNIAILSGDALAIMAFQQLLKLNCDNQIIINIAKVFSDTSLEICEGQQFDLDFETQEHVTIDEYVNMIRLKTAVMFAGCLKSGAILVGADAQSCQALYDLGIHLGLGFQLADDVLDVYGDEATFGKSIGGDIRDNKKTYLYLKTLELANPSQKQQLQQLFSTPTINFEEKYQTVRSIFDDLKVKDITESLILEYVDKSMEDLAKVQVPEEKKEALKSLIMKLVNRQK